MSATRVSSGEAVKGGSSTKIMLGLAAGQLNMGDVLDNNMAKRKATLLSSKVGAIVAKFESLTLLDNLGNDIKTLLDKIKAIPTDPARQAHGLFTKTTTPLLQDAEKDSTENKQLSQTLDTYEIKFLADVKNIFAAVNGKNLDAATSKQLVNQLESAALEIAKYQEMLRKYEVSYNDTRRSMKSILEQMSSAAKPLGILPTITRAEEKAATPRQGG